MIFNLDRKNGEKNLNHNVKIVGNYQKLFKSMLKNYKKNFLNYHHKRVNKINLKV